MKSILTFILATFLLFPLQAQEKVYTVDNLPKVHLQNKMQYVCNPAGILSQAACDSIDSMLYALEQQTGIETVVAVVPSIGEEDCFNFCHQLLNKWGVGKKDKNNGLVILLVTDQRCIQFYTGYGLEGVVAARSQATQIKVDAADLTPEKLAQYQKAQGAVTSALGKLLAITENYPDLKANQNFLELQAQLEGTENRINVARKNFNDAAQAYNTNIRRFPKNIFAGMFGFDKKAYFEAEEGSEKAPKVEF